MSIAELERDAATAELLVVTPWGVARVVRPWARHARLGLGVCFMAASLVLPWIGDPLLTARRSWNLPIRLGWVPLTGHLSYGAVGAAAVVVMVVSVVRSGGRPTAVLRGGAAVVAGTALLFVFATRIIDAQTAFVLHAHLVQHDEIVRQFGYSVPSQSKPSSIAGVGADPTTLTLFGLLRPGWYFAVAAGLTLVGLGRGARRSGAARVGWGRRRVTGVAVVVAAVAAVAGAGLLAQQEKLWAIRAEAADHLNSATEHLDWAIRLDPLLRFDPKVVLTFGQIDVDAGHTSTARALYAEAAGPQAVSLPPAQRALRLDRALNADPSDPVIAEADAELLGGTTATVYLARGPIASGSVLVAYTAGRAAFVHGDDSTTIADMEQAAAWSENNDIKSSCYTYVALAEHGQQNDAAFRRDLELAVRTDTGDHNQLARELAAGLYVPGQ